MLQLVSPAIAGFGNVPPDTLEVYAKRLPFYQKAVKHSPLRAGHTFSITCPRRSHVSASGRQLDPILQHGGTFELELVRSLLPPDRTESIMSSAVWLAEVSRVDGTLVPSPPSVVVKLIQPSQLPYPENVSFHVQLWKRTTSPDWLARNESAGYDRLYALQGTVIPYFFGKHIVSPAP